jgi:excisionase family DNA binding protein
MRESLLTVAEVAARLKCHPHTVRRWIWSRRLSAVKVGDMVRVREQDVARWVVPAQNPERRERKRGARALLATIRRLKSALDPKDVELMERRIREGERSPDWSDPLAR